jgi:hypothetical protein
VQEVVGGLGCWQCQQYFRQVHICTHNEEQQEAQLVFVKPTQVLKLQLVGLDEENLLEIVLDKGETNTTRDQEGVAKRLTIGFKQKQANGSTKSTYHNGICLPWYHQFFADDVRHLMGNKMIEDLGKIWSLSQDYLDDFYGGDTCPPMSDVSVVLLLHQSFVSWY